MMDNPTLGQVANADHKLVFLMTNGMRLEYLLSDEDERDMYINETSRTFTDVRGVSMCIYNAHICAVEVHSMA